MGKTRLKTPLYFCINDVLDRMERAGDAPGRNDILIPVSSEVPGCCGGHPQDSFVLASSPRFLDLLDPEAGPQRLARMIDDTPPYRAAMELALNQALSIRSHNALVKTALIAACGEYSPLLTTDPPADDAVAHPALAAMSAERLSRVYTVFLDGLGHHTQPGFSFENDILGMNKARFLAGYDGYASPQMNKVKAKILVAFGRRRDHDAVKPMEKYIDDGRQRVENMDLREPVEMIWLWMEADEYQMRRAKDIDRIMKFKGLPKLPNWVRFDVFALLERESMKQALAERLLSADPALKTLARTPRISEAVKAAAEGFSGESLLELLSEVLNPQPLYSGAGARLVREGLLRQKETRHLSGPV